MGEELLDLVRDTGSELPLQQMEREIQTRGDASAGHQVAVVDDPGIDRVDPGRGERVETHVMGGGSAARDEPRHREHHGAAADGRHGHAWPVAGGLEQAGQRRLETPAEDRRDGVGAAVVRDAARGPRHQNQIRALGVQRGGGPQREHAQAAGHLARALGRDEFDGECAAGDGAAGAEHFVRGDHVQRVEAVEQNDLGEHPAPVLMSRDLGNPDVPGLS